MRPITGTDIIDFHNTLHDLLVLTADGKFDHIDYTDVEDSRATAYDYAATKNGQVQVLLERSTVEEGEWFPDALTYDGDLIPARADEMADIINGDGILPSRALKAVKASKSWNEAVNSTNRLALARATAVADVVDILGGNQSEAGRVLNLDQSTVNKLVKKAKAV